MTGVQTCALPILQNALILEHPYDEKRLIKTVSQMEKICRDKGIEVIFVRHEDNTLVKGEAGFEIYSQVAPKNDEKIFDKKYNSAFRKTGLDEYLKERGIENLIITGMQTDFCVMRRSRWLLNWATMSSSRAADIRHSITVISPEKNFITITATRSGITAMSR